MKSLKSKLMAAGAMLMVSVVMLTSASFAWFTVSTAPEVSNIQVSMGTTKNLEIANVTAENLTAGPGEVSANDTAAANKYGTWGSTATFTTAAGGIQFPVMEVGSSIKTIAYDDTGRTDQTGQTITLKTPEALTASGVRSYQSTINLGGTTTKDLVVAAGYTVWMRSNVAEAKVDAKLDLTGVTSSGFKTALGASDVIVAITTDNGTTLKGLTSGAEVEDVATLTTANEATKVEVLVFVKGDKIVAADMNQTSAPTISGIKVDFSSDEVPA